LILLPLILHDRNGKGIRSYHHRVTAVHDVCWLANRR